MADPFDARERAIALCGSLPEATVEERGRHVRFAVRGRTFAWLLDDHHGDGRLALNCKVPPGESTALARAEPDRFWLPAYSGARGWIAFALDRDDVDWDRAEQLARDSYRMTAPKRLAREV